MNRYTTLIFTFFGLFFYGSIVVPSGGVATELNESEVRVYGVFGMDCPDCHGGLNKLVEKIPEVLKSEANWKEKRLFVTIKAGSQLNDEAVYDAIRRASFTPGKRIKQ